MPSCHFFFTELDVTMPKLTEQRHNAIRHLKVLVNYRMLLSDILLFAEPLLTGFVCVTTTEEAFVTDRQADREQPP